MNEVFTLNEWFDFVDSCDAFDVRVSGKVSRERVIIACAGGIDIFNKELYEIALDLMGYDESWLDEYEAEITKHRLIS